jgi:hypothetical protein
VLLADVFELLPFELLPEEFWLLFFEADPALPDEEEL